METSRKLTALQIITWNARKYFNYSDPEPMWSEYRLFLSVGEAQEFARNLDNRYPDVYNEALIIKDAELGETAILDITDLNSIEEFDNMMSYPEERFDFSGRDDKREDLAKFLFDCRTPEPTECGNYERESLEGSVIAVWHWEDYVGGHRCLDELRYGRQRENDSLCVRTDRANMPEVDVIIRKEDVSPATIAGNLCDILLDGSWNWSNPLLVGNCIEWIFGE